MAGLEDANTLGDVSAYHAGGRPDRTALIFEGRETSYAGLDRNANRAANAFSAEGLRPGARVALIAKNTDTFFDLLFGASKSGCVLVPVNWRLAPVEIAYIVNDSGAELLIVGDGFAEIAEGLLAEMPKVRKVIALEGGHESWPDYAAWRDAQPDTAPAHAAAPEDVVVQMYTSGTTGQPKGACLTNSNVCSELRLGVDVIGWQDDDVSLVVMPLFHIAGTAWGVYGLYAGVPNIVMRDVDPGLALELIASEGVTRILLVPAVILFMVQHPKIGETDLSSLRLILFGASPITEDLLRQAIAAFGCGFCQVYGMTETTGAITYVPPGDYDDPDSPRFTSCGIPYPETEIRITDVDDNALPPGEIGEVGERSPMNMQGYWNRPEDTAAALRGGWYYTGDAGYLDEDGYLYIHDRLKDMIITGAENVYPAEVESALAAHPGVADVAVIGIPDPTWGEAVKAIVVKDPDREVTEAELVAHARERLAHFKAPSTVDFIDALPRNPSGKILKRELRKPYWGDRERQV